jgi:hypothetical protein
MSAAMWLEQKPNDKLLTQGSVPPQFQSVVDVFIIPHKISNRAVPFPVVGQQ